MNFLLFNWAFFIIVDEPQNHYNRQITLENAHKGQQNSGGVQILSQSTVSLTRKDDASYRLSFLTK